MSGAAKAFAVLAATGSALWGVGGCAGPAPENPFPEQWAAGVDCAQEAPFQVHAYDDGFYVIRQSKCVNYEAPFLFLVVGTSRALLMDTGADADADVYGTVMGILRERASALGVAPVPLVVAHTHSHGDHRSADGQFAGAEGVEAVVGLSVVDVIDFWGFTDWPEGASTFDLGDRVLDVLPIPGHHPSSIAVYDRTTRLLLTGDSVYPGHLFIPSPEAWLDGLASLERLMAFTAANPIEWILGNHIEMSGQPNVPYPYRTAAHPNERPLQLAPSTLREIADGMRQMGDEPRCEVYGDFVIQPTFVCASDWNGDAEPAAGARD